ILSGILITCIVSTSILSALPVSAQTTAEGAHIQVAADQKDNTQTTESSTKEFAINNKKDFSKFMTTPAYWESNYKIKLNCDISWIFFKKFNPIEDFKGDFDGGGHTIKYVMLKCFVKNNQGTISRLNFQKSKLLSSTCGFVGGFAGENKGKITNCAATGNVKGIHDVGGFVGWNDGTISECTSEGTVKGGYGVGGFAGGNQRTITSCTATGNVNGYSVGGFIGYNCCGTITNCKAEGIVVGDGCLGGFAGCNEGKITDCTATGNVNGYNVGGFVGKNYKNGTITNCIAMGKVTEKSKETSCYAGGFAGKNKGIITNCTATGDVNGKKVSLDSFAGENEGKMEDCKIV
ncbi:MAG: hypothetical protein K2I60_02485, partial [Oscillospiraceae bacterium]|nr:hypothetical protein [Oscillospiraceae bacterium]